MPPTAEPGSELKTLPSLPDAAPRRRGRQRGVPPEKRALLPHEKEAVETARKRPRRGFGDTDTASLAKARTWVLGPAIDAALSRVCASAPAARRCAALSCLLFNRLYMDTREYDYEKVQRWTLAKNGKGIPALDVFAADILFVPINPGNAHWALAVVENTEKTITYLDSKLPTGARAQRNRAQPVLENLQRYLEDEWEDKGREGPAPVFSTTVGGVKDTPQQTNGDDCGVFVLSFADAIANGRPLSRTALQKYIPYHRARFAAEVEAA